MNIPNPENVYKDLKNSISESIFSTNSLYGIVFLIIVIALIIWTIRKTRRSLMWWIGFILLAETMHVIAFQTPVGSWIPVFRTIFKYDILTMIAQLCAGTKFSEFLLHVQSYITTVIGTAVAIIAQGLAVVRENT